MSFISQTTLASSSPDLVLSDIACDSGVAVGDWVRMDTGGVAQQASADSLADSNVIGLVESKLTSVLANIRVLGVSQPIFLALDVTKEYLLSVTPGQMNIVAPTNPGEVVLKLGQPFDATRFLVLKGTRLVRS